MVFAAVVAAATSGADTGPGTPSAASTRPLAPPPAPLDADDPRFDPRFDPDARAESVELLALLHDERGEPLSFARRLVRVTLRERGQGGVGAQADARGTEGSFAFDEVVRLDGHLAAGGDTAALFERRDALERIAAGLARADTLALGVRDVSLSLEPAVSDDRCAMTFALDEGDGLALRFHRRRCPQADLGTARLVASTGGPLDVDGTLRIGGTSRAVGGRGWVRRARGELTPPGGAVLFERLLLELDGVGALEIIRSRRRSGRGPVTVTARLHAGDGGDGDDGGTPEAIWLDGVVNAVVGVADDWTLRLPDLGVDVVLEPLVTAAGIGAAAFDPLDGAWRGAVLARGTHAGAGFVEVVPRVNDETGRAQP